MLSGLVSERAGSTHCREVEQGCGEWPSHPWNYPGFSYGAVGPPRFL